MILFITSPVLAEDIARWEFDDRAGTGLSRAMNRAGPAAFDGGATGVSKDGQGALLVRRSLPGSIVRNLDVGEIQSGKIWMDVEFGGWDLRQEPAEEISFGFAGERDLEKVAARLERRRLTNSTIWIHAAADGPGSTDAPMDEFYSRVRLKPLRLVLECDLDRYVYAVYREESDGSWVTLGRGAITEGATIDYFSLRFTNRFNDDPSEYLTINRLAITRQDPLDRANSTDAGAAPFVTAWSWAVADGVTGEIVAGHEIDTPRKSASVTKAMTTFIVCEMAERDPAILTERVVFSDLAVQATGSTANIEAGESLTVRDALFAFMLPSGNAVGNALAEHFNDRLEPATPGEVGGTSSHPRANFLAEMNRTAARIGMESTLYRSAFGDGGTPDERTTTARNLLVLAHTAMTNELFREVVGAASHTAEIVRTDGSVRTATWRNTNQFLHQDDGYDGIKTGTTRFARACLLSSAAIEGRPWYGIVLGSNHSQRRYVDTRNLMTWAARLSRSEELVEVRSVSSVLDAVTPGLMAEANVPGVSVAFIENFRVVWLGQYGVVSMADRRPVTADTVFEAASMSKPAYA